MCIKNSKENVNALNSGLTTTLKKMEQDYKQKREEMEMRYEESVRIVRGKF